MKGDKGLGLEAQGGREGRSEGGGGCRCGSASVTRGLAQQALAAGTISTGGRARLPARSFIPCPLGMRCGLRTGSPCHSQQEGSGKAPQTLDQ